MLHKHCNTDMLGVLLIYPHSPSGAACPRDHAYISVKPLTAVLQPIMYVCMYVCMCVYVYVCVITNGCFLLLRGTTCTLLGSVQTRCVYVCVYVCMHVRMYVLMYICMYAGRYVGI